MISLNRVAQRFEKLEYSCVSNPKIHDQEEHGHEEGGVADEEVHEKALGELHQLGPSEGQWDCLVDCQVALRVSGTVSITI